MSNIMIRCPQTGEDVSTGIATNAATFDQLPDVAARLLCPACGKEHMWKRDAAWLDGSAGLVQDRAVLELDQRESRLQRIELLTRQLPQDSVFYDVLACHMLASVARSVGQRPRHGDGARRIALAAETTESIR